MIRNAANLIKKGVSMLHTAGLRITFRQAVTRLRFPVSRASDKIFSSYSAADLEAQREYVFPKTIKFSILVPLYNTPLPFLEEMIRSVQAQTYSNWELCLADGSDDAHGEVGARVRELQRADGRIQYQRLERNLGISGNTNACIAMATGDYLSLFDHDDVLHPAALYETMRAVCDQGADFIYTDEATFESPEVKKLVSVHCKPDFAPDNLLANNYICHFTSFRRDLLERVGLFRSEYDGSQDHDMVLRLTRQAERIVHIPRVLYFWRSHPQSVAMDLQSKTYAVSAGQRAVGDALTALGCEGVEVTSSAVFPAIYQVSWRLNSRPLVSVVVAAEGTGSLEPCLNSILARTAYGPFEILAVGETALAHRAVRRIPAAPDQSLAEKYNLGAAQSSGEVLVFVNGRCTIETPGWIEALLMYVQRPDVGAAGPLVSRKGRSIWDTGLILGLNSLADCPYRGFPLGYPGYMGRLAYAQEVTALEADCMMVRRELFEVVNGWESQYPARLAALDFCLKLRERGFRNVWTPQARLDFTGTIGGDPADRMAVRRFRARWAAALQAGDPYYNPNFTADGEGFRIACR